MQQSREPEETESAGQLSDAFQCLRRALGIDEDLRGALPVLTRFQAIAVPVVRRLALERQSDWLNSCVEFKQRLTDSVASETISSHARARLTELPVAADAIPARHFAHVLARAAVGGPERYRLDELMVSCVFSAASQAVQLPADFAYGLTRCYKAAGRDGRSDWARFAARATWDVSEIARRASTAPDGVFRAFLECAADLLATELTSPSMGPTRSQPIPVQERKTVEPAAVEVSAGASRVVQPQPPAATDKATEAGAGADDDDDDDDGAPSIAKFARSSEFATLGIKAGVPYLWDATMPRALRRLCRRLRPQLTSTDQKRKAHAALRLLGFLMRCNLKGVIRLKTHWADLDGCDLYVDIVRGWIYWRQDAYTNVFAPSESFPTNRGGWNRIPLPRPLATALREFAAGAVDRSTVLGLVERIWGARGLDIRECNRWLKELGDSAHKAWPTRVVEGYGLTFLRCTGSDLFTAACTFRFDFAAPSAIHYFSPTAAAVEQRCAKVYRYLGLGAPESLGHPTQRMGASIEFDQSDLPGGWARLSQAILDSSSLVRRWPNQAQGVAAFNRLADACAAALVLQFGGRGSKPERMTELAMRAYAGVFAFDDKHLAGGRLPRILPHTTLSECVMRIYLGARSHCLRKLCVSESAWPMHEPLFQHVDAGSAPTRRRPLRLFPVQADAITGLFQEHFNCGLNFSRGLWITHLAESDADRWLIRMLAGHGSDFVRPFSHGMGQAPLDACFDLRALLEERFQCLFGDINKLKAEAKRFERPPRVELALDHAKGHARQPSEVKDRGDPTPLLDEQCLVEASLIEEVRRLLADGSDTLSAIDCAALSRVAFDWVPSVAIACGQVGDPSARSRVGQRHGASHARAHYVHDLWLPFQSVTAGYLWLVDHSTGHKQPSEARIAAWLRALPAFRGWPAEDEAALAIFDRACQCWLRLNLPPHMCAIASPNWATACLSPLSLHRIPSSGKSRGPWTDPPTPIHFDEGARDKSPAKAYDLPWLTSRINYWTNTDLPLGSRERRAESLLADVRAAPTFASSIVQFAAELIEMEMRAWIGRLPWRNKPSSFATRWTAWHPAFTAMEPERPPSEYTAVEWLDLVIKIDRVCAGESVDAGASPQIARTERAQDACQRLLHVLQSMGWDVPMDAWAFIRGQVQKPPRISASSTLIFPGDIEGIHRDAAVAFEGDALLRNHVRIKTVVEQEGLGRVGELSSLPVHCVTADGELVTPLSPFTVDKSKNAPRLVPIGTDAAADIRQHADAVLSIDPSASWIFRFDSIARSRDNRAKAFIAQALRHQSGDSHARLQSFRATKYCEELWPGWMRLATGFLAHEVGPEACLTWCQRMPSRDRWIHPLCISAIAGHGAFDPGGIAYAGAGHIVLAVYLCATLHRLRPGSVLMRQLNLKENTFYAERARRQAPTQSIWSWIASKRPLAPASPLYEEAERVITETPERPAQPPMLSGGELVRLVRHPDAHRYIVERLMEEPRGRVLHNLHLPDALVDAIELRIPEPTYCRRLRSRTKGEETGRALDADLRLAKGEGDDLSPLRRWLSSMPLTQAKLVVGLIDRSPAGIVSLPALRTSAFWLEVTKAMPSDLQLELRFGPERHLDSKQAEILRARVAAVRLGSRTEIGAMPMVMVSTRGKTNPVMDRRRTAVTRVGCEARLIQEQVASALALGAVENPHPISGSQP